MEDLSHLLVPDRISTLAPTSQSAGNMTSGRPAALSAPGSDPVDPLPPAEGQGDPAIGARSHTPPNIVTGGGEHRSRPVIRRGEWNDMGGGPAPS